MNIGHFLLDDETYQIIELRDDKGTEYDQSDCLEPVADKCHVYGYGNPYQCRTCHGYDTGKTCKKARKQNIGSIEYPIAEHGYSALYYGKQRYADRSGTEYRKQADEGMRKENVIS